MVRYPVGAAAALVPLLPADPAADYRLRFPDGGEIVLPRTAFAPRKADRRASLTRALPQPGWDELRSHVVYRALIGSRGYGLHTEASDWDWRGCYVAPADRLWSLAGVPGEIIRHAEGVEEHYWEVEKLIALALKANPSVLEVLYAPRYETHHAVPGTNGLGQVVRDLGRQGVFLSKLVYETFNGYAISQFQKLEQDARTGGAWRWKHAMHLLRLLMAGHDLVATGEMRVMLDPGDERHALLTAIRAGELDYAEVSALRLEWQRRFDAAMATTTLPDRPDYLAADMALERIRRQSAAVCLSRDGDLGRWRG